MAYTCNLLLRTLSVRIQELQADSDDEPVRIDLGGLPHPDRNQPASIPAESSQPS
jgi:hypothetical protein